MYKIKHTCTSCEKELADDERMYSGGCCPHCGALSEGIFVEAKKTSVWVEPRERECSLSTAWFILGFLGFVITLGVLV